MGRRYPCNLWRTILINTLIKCIKVKPYNYKYILPYPSCFKPKSQAPNCLQSSSTLFLFLVQFNKLLMVSVLTFLGALFMIYISSQYMNVRRLLVMLIMQSIYYKVWPWKKNLEGSLSPAYTVGYKKIFLSIMCFSLLDWSGWIEV